MLQPQTVLQNRYQINKQLGQGGMGAVYIAVDQRFGSTVAVKETFFDEANLRKAFEREAKLLNSLRHPALPRVSDHFMESGGQFLVMEFIEGDDLGAMLETKAGGAFPIEQVLHWADQLLDALDYLHSQEPPVIHRDIKPQNLKLTSKGQIILLDFGLAKGSPSQLATKATNTGSIFGYSRFYAPLEQIQGSGTDPRSDIYSLAATLYHLITGLIPPDALSRATAIINGQPDPLVPANEAHAQVNSAVGKVLYQAMSQTSASRQASASILRAQLREAATAVLTNEKATRAFEKVPTILDQDTKIMEGSAANTGSIESKPFHEQQTVQMANAMDAAQISPSNPTVPINQEVSPSYETVAMNPLHVVSNPTPSLNTTATQMDSEVTRLAKKVPAQKSSHAIRYLGIAACVVVLLTASALAYRFAFKGTQTNNSLQNINVDGNNVNASQLPETTNQNANTETPQTTISSQTNEQQQRKQNTQTSSTTKTNNNKSTDNKTDETNQTTQTPTTPNQTADDGHNTTTPPDPRHPSPIGQYPPNMTDAERKRIEAKRRKQIERRRIEQMRRRQIPLKPY